MNIKKQLTILFTLAGISVASIVSIANAYVVGGATITSISPTEIVENETVITIHGTGFQNDQQDNWSKVEFGLTNNDGEIISWSDTKIVVKTPSLYDTSHNSYNRLSVNICASAFQCGRSNYVSYTVATKPACTENDYNCTAWDMCPSYGIQTRDCTLKDSSNCDTSGILPPSETRSCTYVPQCTSNDWSCGDWSVCSANGAKTRTCTKVSTVCEGGVSAPETTMSCSYISNDTYSEYQDYLDVINVKNAWNISKGSSSVIVAVIDDGVYVNHPDLRSNIWINQNEVVGNGIDDDSNGYIDDIYGWDFISDEGEMTTRGSHGTMVAGIIGAASSNNIGITGINWNIRLMPLIVCSSAGCSTNGINQAIRYAADNGADVINLSLSSVMTTGYTTAFDDAVKYAHNKGVLIVAAAGNGDVEGGIGQDLNLIPQSPVCNNGGSNMIIGVGSINSVDNKRTSWSNFGSNCVDIYAPGTGKFEIISTAVPNSSTFNDFYDFGEGTSFSAPMVSGVAALIKAKYPLLNNQNIKNAILSSAKSGILDAYAALNKAQGIQVSSPTPVTSQTHVQRPATTHSMEEIFSDLNSEIIWNGKRVYTDKPTKLPVGYMIKADSDPASYLVMPDGTLRWVETEAVANRIFGPAWDSYIVWITEALVYTYPFGETITE